jgi:hyaluronan synthase
VRWSRNSYPLLPHSGVEGLLWRLPLVSQVTVLQILFTPVPRFAAVGYVAASGIQGRGRQARVLSLTWVLLGRAIRSTGYLRRRPSDLLLLPLVAVGITLVAVPIKTYALSTMNEQGWQTRRADLTGGEGQDEASVVTASAGTVTA